MSATITPLAVARRIRRKVSDFYTDEWGAFYQVGLAELSQDRDLTGETWRVLGALLSMMEKGNHIRVRPLDIAEHLGIRPSQVSRQIKILEAKDVLLPRPLYGWRLNPLYGFKGEPDKSLRRAPGGELVLID